MTRLGFVGGVSSRSRFRILSAVVTAVAALLCWQQAWSGRLVEIDRRVTEVLLPGEGGLHPRPGGDHSWRREQVARPDALPATRLLVLDEDPEGYFETLPPPPADLAVVFARLQRAGVRTLGLGSPLGWEDPDLLATQALRAVLDRFDAPVLGFPLRDSTASAPVARPFLAASLALDEVRGDPGKLPVVNAIRGAVPELGGERALAGFTRLESEREEDGRAFLLARWEDRLVLALPLVVELARRGLSAGDLEISLGRELRLGGEGPRIRIDARGRCVLPEQAEVRTAPLSAVIAGDLPEGFLAPVLPVFTADARVLAADSERQWGERLVRLDTALRAAPQVTGEVALPRPLARFEAPALGLAALVLGWALAGLGGLRRWLVAGLVVIGFAVAIAGGSAHGVPTTLAWLALPGWAALAAAITWLAPAHDEPDEALPFQPFQAPPED